MFVVNLTFLRFILNGFLVLFSPATLANSITAFTSAALVKNEPVKVESVKLPLNIGWFINSTGKVDIKLTNSFVKAILFFS